MKRYRTRSGSVKLNVALSELPAFPSWDQDGELHQGLVAVSPSIEYLERAWDDAKYGRMSEHPYVEVVFPTAHEPEGLAPEGEAPHARVQPVRAVRARARVRGTTAAARSTRARVLKALGEFAPSLESSVEHLEVLRRRTSRSGSA